MKYPFQPYLFSLLLSLIVVGCQSNSEEEIIPSVVVLSSETYPEGGAKLTADFQNISEEDQLGFYVRSDVDSQEYIVLNPSQGINSVTITNRLYLNKRYSFYAFIRTAEGNFYSSESKEFYGTGSVISKISQISPEIGYIGDLVEITFTNKIEGALVEDFSVKFENTEAEIVDLIGEEKLVCRVPNFLSQFTRSTWAKMAITYLDKSIPNDYEFNLRAPIITSISPDFIDWEGEISIKGDFYKEGYPALVYINVNEVPVNQDAIVEISHDEIRLRVSKFMQTNNPKVELWSNYRNVVATNTFSYHNPEIHSFDQDTPGGLIEIRGQYFYPANYFNKVYFDDFEAELISGSPTKLVVKIPNITYTNNRAILKVVLTDEIFSDAIEYLFN